MHGAATLHMGRITFTADDEHEQIVSEVQAEETVESQSAAVRECITRYRDLQQEIDDLEQEIERLKNEKQTIVQQREENKQLVKYVEQEKDIQQRFREAGLLGKMKYTLFGMDSDDE